MRYTCYYLCIKYVRLRLISEKVDQHTGGKWLIHGTQNRKDNQSQTLELPCKISYMQASHGSGKTDRKSPGIRKWNSRLWKSPWIWKMSSKSGNAREKDKRTTQNINPNNQLDSFAFVHSRLPFISTSLIGQTVCGWLVHRSLHGKLSSCLRVPVNSPSNGRTSTRFSLTLEWEITLESELYWQMVLIFLL